jgi:hypothetical protein
LKKMNKIRSSLLLKRAFLLALLPGADGKCYNQNMFKLTREEEKILKKLSTPVKIQDFLDTLPRNMEKHGDTVMSPRMVLQRKKAHCIEAAFLAATALWFHGEKPWVMDLRSTREDYDHVIAIYRRHGYYGAISKTNHVGLRFRDPVYKNPRELAMSYFHEYLQDENGHKTLRAFSKLIDLRKFGSSWITAEEDLFAMAASLNDFKHHRIAPEKNIKNLRPIDHMEFESNKLVEWHKSDLGT